MWYSLHILLSLTLQHIEHTCNNFFLFSKTEFLIQEHCLHQTFFAVHNDSVLSNALFQYSQWKMTAEKLQVITADSEGCRRDLTTKAETAQISSMGEIIICKNTFHIGCII